MTQHLSEISKADSSEIGKADWTYYANDATLASMFTEIWGNCSEPKKTALRRLEKCSAGKFGREGSRLAKIKWFSQQLYARRIDKYSKGEFTFEQFSLTSAEEMDALRKIIAKSIDSADPKSLQNVQNSLLFDCGTRGALEIRLLKTFCRQHTRLSYADKNYEEEIEDLESALKFGIKASEWNKREFLSAFTAENIAILGFFPLLRSMLARFSDHLVFFTDKNKGSDKYAFYVRNEKNVWTPMQCLYDLCEGINEMLSGLAKDFRDLLRERVDFTCVQVPRFDEDFDAWFSRLFENQTYSSREFVNLFEAIWLFTECKEKTLELQAFQFIRKEAAMLLEANSADTEYVISGTALPPATPSQVVNDTEVIPLALGEEAFRCVFHPNSAYDELKRAALLFARRWRKFEKEQKIRKTVVRIKRWD
jgi:hypothetical protein